MVSVLYIRTNIFLLRIATFITFLNSLCSTITTSKLTCNFSTRVQYTLLIKHFLINFNRRLQLLAYLILKIDITWKKNAILYAISFYQFHNLPGKWNKFEMAIHKKRIFDVLMPFVSCHQGKTSHGTTRRKYIARNTVALYTSVISHSYSGTVANEGYPHAFTDATAYPTMTNPRPMSRWLIVMTLLTTADVFFLFSSFSDQRGILVQRRRKKTNKQRKAKKPTKARPWETFNPRDDLT